MTDPKTRLQEALDGAVASFANELIGIIRRSTVEELAGLGDRPTPAARKAPDPRPVPVTTLAPIEVPEPAEEAEEAVGVAPGQVEAVVPTGEAPVVPAKAPDQAKPKRKKRAWPTCSVEGCSSKMYGPSGTATLCYQHHRAAGGEPSPFARKRKAATSSSAPEAPEPEAKPKARKVIRRRKGEQRADDVPPAPSLRLEAVENPPLSAKDGSLLNIEAKLASKKK